MTQRTLQPVFAILTGLLLAGMVAACSQPVPPAAPAPQVAAPTAAPATPAEQAAPTTAAEQPAPTEAAPTAAAAPALAGEISFLIWQNSPGMDKLVGEDLPRMFEQTHPGTKINATVLPYDQYNTKLALLVAGGTPPDIFESGPDFMRYVTEGTVIPLDERFAADPVLSDANQSRVEANDFMKADRQHIYGTQFGSICGMQLYYNMDLFDKAGVAYPDENWTWDDFRAAAKKLTIEENGETVQWGTTWGYLGGWDGGWGPLVWDSGAEYFDSPFQTKALYLDKPEVIAAWQFMQDLVYKDKVAPTPATLDVLSQAGGALLSGKVAMVVDGCWMMQPYKGGNFKLGMSVLPKGPAGRVNTGWFAGGMAIAKASKYPDLAWEYLRWLAVDEEANKALASIGMSCGAPVVKAYDQLYATSWAQIHGGDACTQSLENAKAATIWADAWNEIWTNIISPNWDKFANGEITAQQLSDAINKPANDALTATK
jgi:multiple sugar transport system substrate-binding protein